MKQLISSKSKRRWRRWKRIPGRTYESAARFCKRFVTRIEDFFEAVIKKIASVQDIFGKLEKRGLSFGEWASSPFKWGWRVAVGVLASVLPRRVSKAIGKTSRRVGRQFICGFVRLAEALFL